MKDIKLVACDWYGTIASSFLEKSGKRVLRPNALNLLNLFYSYGIPMVTSSDASSERIIELFPELGVKPEFFQKMYKMIPGQKKDYNPIIADYNIKPENLLVIGNNYKIDIESATELGCQTRFVPEKFPFQEIPESIVTRLGLRCFYQKYLGKEIFPRGRKLERTVN